MLVPSYSNQSPFNLAKQNEPHTIKSLQTQTSHQQVSHCSSRDEFFCRLFFNGDAGIHVSACTE